MSSSTAAAPAVRSIIYLGMDVHKESITIAVLPADAKVPTRLDRLPSELPKLKKWIARVARDGEVRSCYEASGAGYMLHRAFQEWGYACDVIAPSLIPKRPGVQRKHDTRDAADFARLYRAGELVAVRIPSEAEERVRDVVRCRATFQREILKARHYILKFLARPRLRLSRGHPLVHTAPQVAPASHHRVAARPARPARVRFGTVEPVFANLRYKKGLDRFTLGGRTKVDGQWKLICLVQNIEKLAHHGYAA